MNDKIAAYSICKNEESNVPRFMSAIKKCGLDVYVLDTGSTDKTVEMLRARGAHVDVKIIDPFNFSTARNEALKRVPEAFKWVIRLDLDEEILPGSAAVIAGVPDDATQIYHGYVANAFLKYKPTDNTMVHLRHGYKWIGAAHEAVAADSTIVEKPVYVDKVLINHWPPNNRIHTYAKILQAAYDSGDKHYNTLINLGRDLYFENENERAIKILKEYAKCPEASRHDRSYAYCLICKCYRRMNDTNNEKFFALLSVSECRQRRENHTELAYTQLRRLEYQQCIDSIRNALTCELGASLITSNPDDWTYRPYEIGMHAAWEMKNPMLAIEYGRIALGCVGRNKEAEKRIESALRRIGG
jgi:glycosyltransferase involved in cell wall biosynthesis